jgi:cytochrome c553
LLPGVRLTVHLDVLCTHFTAVGDESGVSGVRIQEEEMSYRWKRNVLPVVSVLLFGLMVAAAGCGKKSGDSAGGAGTGGGATGGGDAVALFTANCGKCHRMGQTGGGRAPDLSKAGVAHDASWIADHIKDPKSHNPQSKMPAFGGKLSDGDIQSLASHLASLK